MNPKDPRVEVLLVEDNLADGRLTQEAFADASIPNRLSVVADGVSALAFLGGKGRYAGAPRPALIILDLNLPGMDGRQVLADIRSDASFARVPVVVLSTSALDADITQAYGLHANCYIVKPFDVDDFKAALRALSDFWLGVAELPER